MSGEEKDPKIDTDAIDEAWGEEPSKPPKPRAARVPRSAKPGIAEKKTPRPPRSRRGAQPAPLPKLPADDDPIEFEAETVTRDSMPTFPHPNPLVYDVAPESEPPQRIPKPPRLPKLPRRK